MDLIHTREQADNGYKKYLKSRPVVRCENGMSSDNIQKQFPWLQEVWRWFTEKSVEVDSTVFKLGSRASGLIIMLGLMMVTRDNYFSTDQIKCQDQLGDYGRLFCWTHGYSYIDQSISRKSLNIKRDFGFFGFL